MELQKTSTRKHKKDNQFNSIKKEFKNQSKTNSISNSPIIISKNDKFNDIMYKCENSKSKKDFMDRLYTSDEKEIMDNILKEKEENKSFIKIEDENQQLKKDIIDLKLEIERLNGILTKYEDKTYNLFNQNDSDFKIGSIMEKNKLLLDLEKGQMINKYKLNQFKYDQEI